MGIVGWSWPENEFVGHMPPTQTELWWRFSFVHELLQFNFTMGGDALNAACMEPCGCTRIIIKYT